MVGWSELARAGRVGLRARRVGIGRVVLGLALVVLGGGAAVAGPGNDAAVKGSRPAVTVAGPRVSGAKSTDFCPLYPLVLPAALLNSANLGQAFTGVPRGSGAGQFSWLTWTGVEDAPVLAASLVPPGNSNTYVNPDNTADTLLTAGDYVQGAPGNMNSNAVRTALNALLQQEIVVPVYDLKRGQGNNLDYRTVWFARIVLTAASLTGQGSLSFTYQGRKNCYNDPPVAPDLALQTPRDTALAVTLTATDPENDTLSYAVVESPSHGTLTGSVPNLIYTPAAGYVGSDRIRFTASDGEFTSAPGEITINVTGVGNRPPAAVAQVVSLNEDGTLAIVLAGSDADGDALSFRVTVAPTQGRLSGVAPTLIYTPAANFHGSDSFDFVVSDGQADSAPATVSLTINPVNDAPVAVAASLPASEDTALALVLSATDIDGDTLTYSVISTPSHGSLSGTAPDLSYTPAANYHGSDSFQFVVNDGQVNSAPVTVSLSIAPVNDVPAANVASLTVTGANTAITLSGSDADNDPLSFVISTPPQHGTLSGTAPNLSYT
ncbi:MAG: tandem-95 repeat protein, partial [Rhodanobacteraceae bacterium]|nr:tandem-95 repeat protein [Rhodanobacteraceae bacterium]